MRQPSEGRSDALASQTRDPRDESIGELVSRLIEDGRAYARAELDLVKRIASHRAGKAKSGAILLGIGVTLLLCSLTALVLALGARPCDSDRPVRRRHGRVLVLAVAGGLLARSGCSRPGCTWRRRG
jgi:hypothetical protein